MSKKEIEQSGIIAYRNELGQYHREDGPALIYPNGDEIWFFNNKCHRIGGPAENCKSGTKIWLKNGKRHRLNAPAAFFSSCSIKEFWEFGKYIRSVE